MPSFGYQDARGLDVAVHDAFAVSAMSASAISNGIGSSSSKSIGRPAIACFSVWPSKNSVTMKPGRLFADVVDGADVGMVERRGGLSFDNETLAGKELMNSTLNIFVVATICAVAIAFPINY